jgi:hypothetical protein
MLEETSLRSLKVKTFLSENIFLLLQQKKQQNQF